LIWEQGKTGLKQNIKKQTDTIKIKSNTDIYLTMKLSIQLSGIARELAVQECLDIDIKNPDQFYDTVLKSIPDLEKYYFLISINGKKSENYSSITEEDNILVFSPIAGG
jgi:hypothetical protein